MPIITQPISVNWGTTGLAGVLGYALYDGADSVLVARTTAGVAEFPAGSGLYNADVTGFDTTWSGQIVWDDGAGNYAQEGFSAADIVAIANGSGGASITLPAGLCYFNDTTDADTIASAIPPSLIPAYNALSDPAAKLVLLQQASYDIDHAFRYQGRRYDTITQTTEFPRVAYEPSNAILPNTGAAGIPGGSAFGSTIWDVDPTTLLVSVPVAVLNAVIFQANYLAGGENSALTDQFAGVKDQRTGGVAQTYDRDNHALKTGLCRRAYQLVWKYRLTTGRIM